MKTITLLNEKGGVGKTTLSTFLATEFARRGFTTLLVDADSQGHATLAVRAKRANHLHALLTTNTALDKLIVPVHPDYYAGNPEQPTLWLLPGSSRTAELSTGLDARLLAHRLQQVVGIFDLMIIDTSPSISDLHASFYVASDYIIYPTECTYMPMQGLIKSLKHLDTARQQLARQNIPCADILGIIPSKFNGRESVQHQNLGYLRGKYGDDLVFSPVRRLTAWEQASQLRMPVTLHDSRSQAAKDALRLADEVLAKLEVNINA